MINKYNSNKVNVLFFKYLKSIIIQIYANSIEVFN